MQYSRDEHLKFLEEEYRAQVESFVLKLNTSALFLLQERSELFVAQFLKFHEGEMILKFSNNRGLPRQGEYLYCFTVPKEFRDYRNWQDRTYGDLVKAHDNYSEVVCIWQAPSDDNDFSIAGFRGVDIEFAADIQDAPGIILFLGPNKPPEEYISNLQNIVKNHSNKSIKIILDIDFRSIKWLPFLLDNKVNNYDFIRDQLELQDTLIIQGPPGTGKTYFIAELIAGLAKENKSILVTALTNRALIEIAVKPVLKELLEQNRIFKTKLSVDEANLIKDLRKIKEINPQPGNIILSTFYITSGSASKILSEAPFDYVIVDEASQGLLAMFAGASMLGIKNIWVGDTKQLPPVVSLSNDKVNSKNYGAMVDGLKALADNSSFPIFQFTQSYRLTERSAKYTGFFYNGSLISKAKKDYRLQFDEIPFEIGKFLNPYGGPTLIKTDLPVGSFKPEFGINIVFDFVCCLLKTNDKLHITVLSYFVETTKAMQKKVFQNIGYNRNLLIETVSRIQGLTTDVCIYLIPNVSYYRSLENRIFNVATSRAKRHTLIIADKNVLSRANIDNEVKQYLVLLEDEFSFYIPHSIEKKLPPH